MKNVAAPQLLGCCALHDCRWIGPDSGGPPPLTEEACHGKDTLVASKADLTEGQWRFEVEVGASRLKCAVLVIR